MPASLKIIPFEAEHLRQLTPREFEAREMAALRDWQQRGEFYMKAGPAWTGIYNGQIMGCCGLIILWQGVAEAWMVTTESCGKYRLSFHRAVKQGLWRVMTDLGLRRVEVKVNTDHHASRLWVERLGFAFEGMKRRYGPDGSNYVAFARVT